MVATLNGPIIKEGFSFTLQPLNMDPPASPPPQLESNHVGVTSTTATSYQSEWASTLMQDVSTRLVEMHALIDEGEELTAEEGEEFEQLYLLEAQLQLGQEPDEALLEAHWARQWVNRPRTPHSLCWSPVLLEQGVTEKHLLEDDEDWVYLPETDSSRYVSMSHLLLWHEPLTTVTVRTTRILTTNSDTYIIWLFIGSAVIPISKERGRTKEFTLCFEGTSGEMRSIIIILMYRKFHVMFADSSSASSHMVANALLCSRGQ